MQMPPGKIDVVMFAPCGMNCFVCYKHCLHKKPCAGCLRGDRSNRNIAGNVRLRTVCTQKDFHTALNVPPIRAYG